MTKSKATKKANALVKRLGKGWKTRIWENLGWYYRAEAIEGMLTIAEEIHASGRCTYWCMLADDFRFPGAGSMIWTNNKFYDTPEKAIRATVKLASQKVTALMAIVESASLVDNRLKR